MTHVHELLESHALTSPPGIALRSVKHAWHGFSVIMFYVFVVLGLASSGIYRKLTPNM